MNHPLRLWATAWLMMLLLAALTLGLARPAAAVPEFQLLTNPGMELYDPPYSQFDGVDCQVATGWQRFWTAGPEPCWMDTRVFASSHLGTGWVDHREGETSQLIVSREPYTAGLWQQVTGVTPGIGYGFRGPMLTIFQTSAQDPVDGTMIKQVGLDPTGGTDPLAPTVIWSEPDDHDQGPWDVQRRAAAWAEAPTVTVFVRVISPYPSGDPSLLNLSFFDWNILAETPLVTATSPTVSENPAFAVSWDNAQPAPGGYVVKYDVQWLDEAEGVWHDWFERTSDVQATFVGEWGHVYRFRARAWQRYEDDQRLYGPYRPDGDTLTRVGGPRLVGQVANHEEGPVGGATVVVSGTAYAATSAADGRYALDLPVLSGPQAVVVSHTGWLSPAPVFSLTFGPTETLALTWTLRPLDDAVVNGGFEAGLEGWTLFGEQGMLPRLVGGPVHTGRGALALGSDAPTSLTVGLSQVVTLTNAWEPALSFWYFPVGADPDERFNVVVSLPAGGSRVFTPALDLPGWQHRRYYPGPPGAALTSALTVSFQVWHDGDPLTTTVYLDEVSLGATPGGPFKHYLPLTLKQY